MNTWLNGSRTRNGFKGYEAETEFALDSPDTSAIYEVEITALIDWSGACQKWTCWKILGSRQIPNLLVILIIFMLSETLGDL